MLIELFKALNEKYPPPENCRHAIIPGPEGKSIILYIWIDGNSHGFEMYEEEELKNPKQILDDIEEIYTKIMTNDGHIYAKRDHMSQGEYYMRHVHGMTRENLRSKSAIAGELAHRDIQIDRLQAQLDHLLELYCAEKNNEQ